VYDEEPDHDDGGPSGRGVRGPGVLKGAGDTSDDEVTGGHADCTSDEHRLSTELVDVHDGWNSGDEHDNADDACGEEGDGVGGEAEIIKDLGGVVEHCIVASDRQQRL